MSAVATELTKRQRQILSLARDGFTYKEIAGTLGVTTGTISGQVQDIKRRLNALNIGHAVVIAMRCGYIELRGRK